MAEGARLESVYTGNRIVGSNPTPSAKSPVDQRLPTSISAHKMLDMAFLLGAWIGPPRSDSTAQKMGRDVGFGGQFCGSVASRAISGQGGVQQGSRLLTARMMELAPAQRRRQPIGEFAQHLRGRLHGKNVAIGAQSADNGRRRRGQYRVTMQFIPGVNVGNVQLNDRPAECFQCVEQGNRGERISGGIDDERVRLVARFVPPGLPRCLPGSTGGKRRRCQQSRQTHRDSLLQRQQASSLHRCRAP